MSEFSEVNKSVFQPKPPEYFPPILKTEFHPTPPKKETPPQFFPPPPTTPSEPNSPQELPPSQVTISYKGSYQSQLQWEHSAIEAAIGSLDIRSHVEITHKHIPPPHSGEYIQLGDIAARKAYDDPKEAFRKHPKSNQSKEVSIDFNPEKSETKISINSEPIVERLKNEKRESPATFTTELNTAVQVGLQEAKHQETLHRLKQIGKSLGLPILADTIFIGGIVLTPIRIASSPDFSDPVLLALTIASTVPATFAAGAISRGIFDFTKNRPVQTLHEIMDYATDLLHEESNHQTVRTIFRILKFLPYMLESLTNSNITPPQINFSSDLNPLNQIKDYLFPQKPKSEPLVHLKN